MKNGVFDPFSVHHTVLRQSIQDRKLINLSISFFKSQFLFEIKSFKVKLLIVGLVSIFSGFCNFFLLERTGLYSLGINSIFQAIARCTTYFISSSSDVSIGIGSRVLHSILFWGMSLMINVPLAIFGYRNIGKQFTILTIFSIGVSAIISIILFSLPDKLGLKDFYLFSDPRTFNKCLTDKRINILHWNYVSLIEQKIEQSSKSIMALNDSSNVVLIFFYGVIFGLLNTFTSLIIYSLGGSTGGIDWIIFYLSKSKTNIANNFLMYFGFIVTFFSYLIGTYIPYFHHMYNSHECSANLSENGANLVIKAAQAINNKNHVMISNIFGPMFIAATISALTKKFCFSIFYPRFKLVNVKIFTNKILDLRNSLIDSQFPHGFTINKATGGYLLRNQNVIEVICFALELKKIKECTRKIDKKCLIVVTPIKSVDGGMDIRHKFIN